MKLDRVNQEISPRKKRFFFLLPLAFCLLTFLTGCVRYDLGIDVEGEHRGAIVGHIKLGKQLASFSQLEVNQLLSSIEGRAKQLQGKAKRTSPQEIEVTIPFYNGKELAAKFNQFFNPHQGTPVDAIDVLQLNSQMSLHQSNLLLLQRNRLSLSVDLRPLGVLSEQGNVIVSPGSLIDLEFSLKAPWGARSLAIENALTPEIRENGDRLVWQLQLGQLNNIEAVFWLPSPLGIGAIVIILLVLAGFYLKYKRFPWMAEGALSVAVKEGA